MNAAIIGCGSMGTLHAWNADTCGMKVVACGDVDKTSAEALAARFDAEASTDCAALTRREDVDVVAIATPTPSHCEYIVAAARAGKDIFCEKPLGRDMEQCKEALAAVEAAGVKLFVGHVVRYFDEFERIRSAIQDGKVGKVGFVKTYRGGIFPQGNRLWFGDWEMSGGVTLDTIIHDFDWVRYVFGDPVRVFAQNLKRVFDRRIDYGLVTFRMKSGVIVNVVGTWAHPAGFRVRVEVCGDKGMVTFDSNEAPINSMMRSVEGQPGMLLPESPVPVSPYLAEWQDFTAWLKGESEPRVKPGDALWAVRMACGALESAETGQPVSLR